MPTRDPRYQHQRWYVKLWRRRHQVFVPFTALSIRKGMRGKKVAPELPDSRDYEFRDAWGLAVGLSHVKMKWYFDWEEVKQRWDERKKKRETPS